MHLTYNYNFTNFAYVSGKRFPASGLEPGASGPLYSTSGNLPSLVRRTPCMIHVGVTAPGELCLLFTLHSTIIINPKLFYG